MNRINFLAFWIWHYLTCGSAPCREHLPFTGKLIYNAKGGWRGLQLFVLWLAILLAAEIAALIILIFNQL